MRAWTFTVPGQPVPKGRPRFALRPDPDGITRKPLVYTPNRTKAYEKQVGLQALAAGVRGAPPGVAVSLVVWVYTRDFGVDLSNVEKVVEDGLNGIAYVDDKQVCILVGRKWLERECPRVVVRLRWLD